MTSSDSTRATFVDYFRCPPGLVTLGTSPNLSERPEYFEFRGQQCFGRVSRTNGAGAAEAVLPFDLGEIVSNLRFEHYRDARQRSRPRVVVKAAAERVYYLLRPLLPVAVRKHLQQARLRGWQQISFPRWPVDATVDHVMQDTMRLLLKSGQASCVPFVWFWPEGLASCTMLTHDVEGRAGFDFLETLMALDDRFGIKASYQLIPERSQSADAYAAAIRERGCEVNIHDWNHDGLLFRDRETFLKRARLINDYARRLGCDGFRSGAMYREQSWYSAFDFKFDMSVPSVAHLEPQRGGCCTVMPYFVGDILELPLTTAQDYSLFFILGDYSTDLWREQIEAILACNGLVSIIAHPDYLIGPDERRVYTELLEYLASLRDAGRTWVARPSEINQWWRARREMTLTPSGTSWQVTGPESHRARVAYASLQGDRVVYSFGHAS